MAALWRAHPFREGNTRTVVTFCCQFIESKGIYIDSSLFHQNAQYLRTALVASSAIFNDLGDMRKPEYLEKIVGDALQAGRRIKDDVRNRIENAGIRITEKKIRDIVFLDRIQDKKSSREDIQIYLQKKKEKRNRR